MSDFENDSGQAPAEHDLDGGGRPRRSTPPGKATLTSRLGASPSSIARAVVAQLKEDAGAPAVQARGDLAGPDVHAAAAHGTAGSGGPLPFLDEIQRAFGHHDVTGVSAHVGGQAAEASAAMGARAYAAGDDVAFAEAPDLHLAAHEAAHVVQQRAGVRLSGGVGHAGDEYERHADAVADGVVRGDFVQDLLGDLAHRGRAGGPAVQREHIPVQWGGTVAGDDSTLDLTPTAEVWINGQRTQNEPLSGTTGSVTIRPGQSGILRVRLGVRYLIDNTWINDDGSAEQIAGMSFTCDASGRLVWGDDTSRATPPPTTSAFQVDASASGNRNRMTGVFRFSGPQQSSRTVEGNGQIGGGDVPASGGVTVRGGQSTHPAGALSRRYIISVNGPTAFGEESSGGSGGSGGGGGGGGGGASSTATATATGNGGSSTATGGSATSSPTVTQSVVVQQPAPGTDPAAPTPRSPAQSVALPEPWVGIYQNERDTTLRDEQLDELARWIAALSPELRAGLEANLYQIEIETGASTTGPTIANQGLTESRAQELQRFIHARTPGEVIERLRSLGEHSRDGTPRQQGQPTASHRRATVRAVRRGG